MQRKQSRFGQESMDFSNRARDFLMKFKVHPCTLHYQHYLQECQYYHSRDDRRRCPYNGYYMAYYPTQMVCQCDSQDCKNCHSAYEYFFHPFVYKTRHCQGICSQPMLCYGMHHSQLPYLQKHQFFRFDLQTFKTIHCELQHHNNSEYASCRFFHTDGDRRRDPSAFNYSHIECAIRCNDRNCQFSHNKIQQLYHPQRYKSKYCSRILKKQNCQYLQFCSFAHHDEEITIQLLHKLEHDENFFYYKFKTVWCPYTQKQVWVNEAMIDRIVTMRIISMIIVEILYALGIRYNSRHIQTGDCPAWNKNKTIDCLEQSGCQKRMECNKCHGWFENKYHPDNLVKSQQEDKTKNARSPDVRRQEGLGTGAPFYKLEEKQKNQKKPEEKIIESKSIKGQKSQQLSEKQSKEEEKAQSNENKSEEQTREIKKRKYKTRRDNSKRSASLRNFWLFYNTQDVNVWYSPARNSPRFFQEDENNENEPAKSIYSSSFKKLLAHYGLEEKLVKLGINQVTLLSLREEDMDKLKPFANWSKEEKRSFLLAVNKYKNQTKHLEYSHSFVRIFRNHQGRGILEKLNTRKMSQKRVLQLSRNSINQLSFLAETQKEKLPSILENYFDQRNFKEINQGIKTELSSTT